MVFWILPALTTEKIQRKDLVTGIQFIWNQWLPAVCHDGHGVQIVVTMDAQPTRKKRLRPTKITTDDVLRQARDVWRRNPDKARSAETEDRVFREHFGCSVLVFIVLWNMLVTTNVLPEGGMIEHLLWTLLFLKEYAKQHVLCSMCGGVDKDTFREWVWKFIFAIVELEPLVVSPW